MRSAEDSRRLATLRSQTESILKTVIGDVTSVAIIDAPNQRNVGDSLIWEGEIAYLKRLGKRVRYVSDLKGFNASTLRRRLPKDGVVLIHGGGNFGDLWLRHQVHRESVVAELNDYKIVQLSQSIYFSDARRAAKANAALAGHPDFTVLIRDTLSIERAKASLPDIDIVFCPDMALGYEPSFDQKRVEVDRHVVVIARADKEAASGLRGIPENWSAPATMNVTDWGHHAREKVTWRVSRRIAWVQHMLASVRRKFRIPLPSLPQKLVQLAIAEINKCNVESAVKLYSSADVIVVDRLHAHVLALLIGIDHVMLDNNYRKLRGVYDDYTSVFSTARYHLDLSEAQLEVQRLVDA